MRWFKAAGGLLAIMLLFASCIKVDGAIRIADDGSGEVDFLTAINTEVMNDVLGDFDVPMDDFGGDAGLCSDFESEFGDADDVPDGATVTPYNEDGFCGSRVTYALAASTDHSAAITDLFDDTARLYKEGDNWFFDTGFDVNDITSETEGAPQAMIDALFGESSMVISVDLPGKAIAGENNATSVGDDGKFTWDIDIFNPPARLFAQTEPGSGGGAGGGGLNPAIIIGIVALLAAAGAGFWFMKQRGGAGASTAADMPLAGATPAAAPGAMPLSDGPPIAASPVVAADAADATKETVIMSSQDLIDSTPAAAVDEAATAATAPVDEAATAATAAATTTDPVYDEALGAWVVDDPTRGRLRHDTATDTWIPV